MFLKLYVSYIFRNWVRNIGIGIIIGTLILGILKVAIPDMFNSIILKIKTTFEIN